MWAGAIPMCATPIWITLARVKLEVIGTVLLTSVWLLILATGGMTNGGERSEVELGSCGSVRRW